MLKHKSKELSDFITAAKDDSNYQDLLDFVVEKNVKLFLKANQYLNFNDEDLRELEGVYRLLFNQLQQLGAQTELSDSEVDNLFRAHYENLQSFLLQTNGENLFKKYKESSDILSIQCAEYQSEFQIELLNIDLTMIQEPILDVGCGSQAHLVEFLRANGIEAYGIDRGIDSSNYLFNQNWLEYNFKPNTWGTIISHMAFSNHFMHHHLRPDGDFETYAKKYMEILQSLKCEGSFLYGPSLFFIEEILMSSNQPYSIEFMENTTKITKLK
ncbi:class I SAM-dependent methyltransferase [Paenibacillus sp. UY79]|nr:class I SAM-dependent methyltransferase [Paenibacillus farraposensis]